MIASSILSYIHAQKAIDGDYHGVVHEAEDDRLHSAIVVPGYAVRLLANLRDSPWAKTMLSADHSHNQLPTSATKGGAAVAVKLHGGPGMVGVTFMALAQNNETEAETKRLIATLDHAIGKVIASPADSDPRFWTELWGDEKVIAAFKKAYPDGGVHFYPDFKHLSDNLDSALRAPAREFVMRSLPTAADIVRQQMAATCGGERVEKAFSNGN